MSDEHDTVPADLWLDLGYFLGRWQGAGTGNPGQSRVEREYRQILNDQFIQLTDRSVYEPQERSPDGEVHEEIGYLSYDKNRQRYILREFHVEGYVNQYVLEEREPGSRTFVFRTEAIENIAPGWQARTTYEIVDENRFRETFELAGPDQEWRCFITNELERV